MKKIFLIFIFFALASCDAPQQNPNFEKNVERAQEWFDKWEEEDLYYLRSKIGDENICIFEQVKKYLLTFILRKVDCHSTL